MSIGLQWHSNQKAIPQVGKRCCESGDRMGVHAEAHSSGESISDIPVIFQISLKCLIASDRKYSLREWIGTKEE